MRLIHSYFECKYKFIYFFNLQGSRWKRSAQCADSMSAAIKMRACDRARASASIGGHRRISAIDRRPPGIPAVALRPAQRVPAFPVEFPGRREPAETGPRPPHQSAKNQIQFDFLPISCYSSASSRIPFGPFSENPRPAEWLRTTRWNRLPDRGRLIRDRMIRDRWMSLNRSRKD
jgi:hypothetical protein